MTPEERQRVDELFDRLAKLETTPRDRDANRAIAEGLERAPNAIYPLVQTVLIQDEALKRADARIRELSGEGEAPSGGGFLDNMRNVLTGSARGSVPSVRPNEPDRRWNSGGAFNQSAPPPQQAAAPQPSQGGSFLGTAAASAAGMIGGALLLNSMSSMFGHRGGSAFADTPSTGSSSGSSSESPWSGNAANSDLARDAGVNDIGRGNSGAGLLDTDQDVGDQAGLSGDIGSDFGGDSGGGDTA